MDEVLRKSLDKFGSHFIVASMVPSLAFIVVILVIFDPYFRILSDASKGNNQLFNIFSITLFLLIPTIILGFTLTVLNTYIFKFFEGYSFFWRFPPLLKNQKNKALLLSYEIDQLGRTIERLEKRKESRRAVNDLSILKDRYYELAAKYDQSYPPSIENILPTNFGNTLRASEIYPATRYGIDSVTFWPRLVQVVPDRYQNYIDQSRNEVSFLLNCTILSVFLLIGCIVAIINEYQNIYDNFDFANIFHYPLAYILLAILFLVLALFFNKAANVVVSTFGAMIRSSYDLFRFDLLEQLRLKVPKDLGEEFRIWKNLGELVVLGQFSMDFTTLKYTKKPQKGDS